MEDRILTLAVLEEEKACYPQQRLFEKRFGREVKVTVELAVAQALDWDWEWAAKYLTPNSYHTYLTQTRSAENAYSNVMRPLWNEESDAVNRGREADAAVKRQWQTDHGENGLWNLPDDVWDAAQAAWQAIVGPVATRVTETHTAAHQVLQEARARMFAELYIKEGNQNSE